MPHSSLSMGRNHTSNLHSKSSKQLSPTCSSTRVKMCLETQLKTIAAPSCSWCARRKVSWAQSQPPPTSTRRSTTLFSNRNSSIIWPTKMMRCWSLRKLEKVVIEG